MTVDSLPMVDAVNVLVFLEGPVLGNVDHADLLALIDEWGTGLEAEELGKEFAAVDTVFG